jgi:hypothetical protein
MDENKNKVHKFSNGEIYFWVEQESSIMLKAVTSFGDPVELEGKEAIELAKALLEAVKKIE